MSKRKAITVGITSTQRKFRGYLTQEQKIRKEFKKGNKEITFKIWQELTKHSMSKQTESTT